MQSNLLVSCTVVSYNSEKTILETLESIKAQTYQNIELIVSDDCSTDNTIAVCSQWIEKNRNRFSRVELITSNRNTGVSANGNRALSACRGTWRKGIAADDKLLPNCVEDFMNFVKEHPDAFWVSSYMRVYNETFDEVNCIKEKAVDSRSFFDRDVNGQLTEIAKRNQINAPSLFFRMSLIKEIKYNELYAFEDWPFYVDALEKGYKCFFMPIETVCYRIHSSISNSTGKLFKYEMLIQYRAFAEERLFKYLTKKQIKGTKIIWKLEDIIENSHLNKSTPVMSFFYKKIMALVLRIYR